MEESLRIVVFQGVGLTMTSHRLSSSTIPLPYSFIAIRRVLSQTMAIFHGIQVVVISIAFRYNKPLSLDHFLQYDVCFYDI